MINRKSAREMKLKNIIQGKLTTYSAKLSSSSFSSRNHSNSKCPKTSRISQSKGKKNPLRCIEQKMLQNLFIYNSTITSYNIKIINDIIYDEKKHIVCSFKNYLLWDEVSDFLKRFYYKSEAIKRLPRITGYYEKYTLFSPVYYQLECIKLMMKNIKRKKRYLEMIEENEDRNANDEMMNKDTVKEFKNIIKPEDVLTNETRESLLKDIINDKDKERKEDLSLTIYLKDEIMLSNINGNINLSQLVNNITATSILTNANKWPFDNNNNNNDDDDEINQSLFHNDQYINMKKGDYASLKENNNHNKHKMIHDNNNNKHLSHSKKTKGIEIKKLNLNKIKGLEQESEGGQGSKSKKISSNNLQEKIANANRPVSNHLSKKTTNNNVIEHHIGYDTNHKTQKNYIDGEIKSTIASSLTATLKAKHKNRIIKDKGEKFTSIDNLFRIIQFPLKQPIIDNNNHNTINTKNNIQNTIQKPITSRLISTSKSKDHPKKPNTILITNNTKLPIKHESTTKKKKSNLVINHNSIKNQKPILTLRNSKNDSSLRDESSQSHSKDQSKSQLKSNSIKKKLTPNFTQKTKYINPLTNTLVNYSKQINEKMVISSVIPQSIYNINLNVNVHSSTITKPNNLSNSHSKGKQNNNVLSDSLNNNKNNNTKMKKSEQTIASVTANSSKNKEKISYDLNNLHISINKQTNGSTENQSINNNNNNNPSLNININCNSIDNQKKENKTKEKTYYHRIPEKKISRNDKNAIEKVQSSHSHTNKIKNMVIPINSANGKDYKAMIKQKNINSNKIITHNKDEREKEEGGGVSSVSKEKKNDNHDKKNNNNKHKSLCKNNNKGNEISMSLNLIDQQQRKYPLTSRNEKESIPVRILNKIMKKN